MGPEEEETLADKLGARQLFLLRFTATHSMAVRSKMANGLELWQTLVGSSETLRKQHHKFGKRHR